MSGPFDDDDIDDDEVEDEEPDDFSDETVDDGAPMELVDDGGWLEEDEAA